MQSGAFPMQRHGKEATFTTQDISPGEAQAVSPKKPVVDRDQAMQTLSIRQWQQQA
jgi:hypothetical protein